MFDIIWHPNEFYGVANLDAYYTFIRILILLIKKTPDQAKIAFFSLACFKNKLIVEKLIDLYMWKSSRDF